MKYRSLVSLAAFLALVVPSQGAQAYVECPKTLETIMSGDEGYLWLVFTQGGAAVVSPTDPDREATLALAMTALAGGRNVIVRYQSDSANCAQTNYDVIGFWLR